jgi:hypothetical protein
MNHLKKVLQDDDHSHRSITQIPQNCINLLWFYLLEINLNIMEKVKAVFLKKLLDV